MSRGGCSRRHRAGIEDSSSIPSRTPRDMIPPVTDCGDVVERLSKWYIWLSHSSLVNMVFLSACQRIARTQSFTRKKSNREENEENHVEA
eukprot:gene9663-biopygen2859